MIGYYCWYDCIDGWGERFALLFKVDCSDDRSTSVSATRSSVVHSLQVLHFVAHGRSQYKSRHRSSRSLCARVGVTSACVRCLRSELSGLASPMPGCGSGTEVPTIPVCAKSSGVLSFVVLSGLEFFFFLVSSHGHRFSQFNFWTPFQYW